MPDLLAVDRLAPRVEADVIEIYVVPFAAVWALDYPALLRPAGVGGLDVARALDGGGGDLHALSVVKRGLSGFR